MLAAATSAPLSTAVTAIPEKAALLIKLLLLMDINDPLQSKTFPFKAIINDHSFNVNDLKC
jgi:hypothetical protein